MHATYARPHTARQMSERMALTVANNRHRDPFEPGNRWKTPRGGHLTPFS